MITGIRTHLNYDSMKREIKVWLVTSEHLEDSLWFREESDFIVGMNYVAVQVTVSKVTVLAHILMSNHVHFLIVGTREEAEHFINGYKSRYSNYLQRKYGFLKTLKGNDVDIREIPMDPESIAWAAAYVVNNSVAANICSYPTQYPWGSGDVYFNCQPVQGLPLANISDRERIRRLKSKIVLPGEWQLNASGYISPSFYVDKKYMEEVVFTSPRKMHYYITYSSKARMRMEMSEDSLPSFRDQTVIAAIPDLCRSLFGKAGFHELNDTQKVEFLRQLRYRFSSNVNQLARVTGLKYEEAAKLLDRPVQKL